MDQHRQAIEHEINGKCICQACNCGKHHCPNPFHRRKYPPKHRNFILPQDKFSGQSSYHRSFSQKDQIKPAQKIMPKNQLTLSKDPLQANTSYIQDYLGKVKAEKTQKAKLPQNQILPRGSFDGNSSYHAHYIGMNAQKQTKINREGELKVGGAFEGLSSYGANYDYKGRPVRAERVPYPKNQVIPEGKFDGNSLYHASYLQEKIQKLKQIKPEGSLKLGGDFTGQSSYGSHYVNMGSVPKLQKVLHPKHYLFPQGRFSGQSNYNDQFLTNKYDRVSQIRPKNQLKLGGEFQGSTSYEHDFIQRGKPQKLQKVQLPGHQIIPEGRFQGASSYSGHYIANNPQPSKRYRPEGQLKLNEGKFQAATNYTNNYNGRGQPQRPNRVPYPHNQVLPQGKFQANSTYKGNYLQNKVEKRSQFRPQQMLKVGGKFEGQSTYLNTFKNLPTQKHAKCPVEELQAPKYQIEGKDHIKYNENAHRWQ